MTAQPVTHAGIFDAGGHHPLDGEQSVAWSSTAASIFEPLAEQFVARALVITVPPVEGTRAPIVLAELQLHRHAPRTGQVALSNSEQGCPYTVGPGRRRHEELIDFGRQPLLLETEDVHGDEIAHQLAVRLGNPDGAKLRLRCNPGKQRCNSNRVESLHAFEVPVLAYQR